MNLSRCDSLRALERMLLTCFRTPFDTNNLPNPVFRAHMEEVIPMLDRATVREFGRHLTGARTRYQNDAAAMGQTLAWVYDQLRKEGEVP